MPTNHCLQEPLCLQKCRWAPSAILQCPPAGIVPHSYQLPPRLALSALLIICTAAFSQQYLPNLTPDHPAIHYSAPATADLVARNQAKLDCHPDEPACLPTLLDRLGIPADSQALVFSKTSFQASRISPRNPRAIYFNDEAAVGWVRGSDSMELAAVDPIQGVIFYTLDPTGLHRQETCLHCHVGPATQGVPGLFIGSVYPGISGLPDRTGAIITDHRTPFADRWGGWYVNAKHGEQPDRANGIAPDPAEPHTLQTRQNLATLVRDFNPAGYLKPSSDIVALMVFEHQTQMINYITRIGWEARMGQNIDADLDALVRYMTFADEARLVEPIEGVSTFTRTFPQRGPRDRRGRSLRDFDLQTRLFRYPLSYLIYSAQFGALPPAVRDRIYRKLTPYLQLHPDIREILQDTCDAGTLACRASPGEHGTPPGARPGPPGI